MKTNLLSCLEIGAAFVSCSGANSEDNTCADSNTVKSPGNTSMAQTLSDTLHVNPPLQNLSKSGGLSAHFFNQII